ncbi:hypothetical protein Ae201684_002350 [Aphanomyces euteiches]|uniref:DDE Tnp4 domain-containing protein n=1 Tax=Aphanomyces euteiches TaxID=100861 RepID=A0A6G0XQE4_9STRA|nr:hypothetical protein Ae201684_002350 [Aphanomyces euteiches]
MPAPPVMSDTEVAVFIAEIMRRCHGDIDELLSVMEIALSHGIIRRRPQRPLVSYNNFFDRSCDDATAIHKYRFTIEQLQVLTVSLNFPAWITTQWMDKVDSLEAIAMTCRSLAEPSRLFTVANEFGRSTEACSRVVQTTVRHIYTNFADIIFFQDELMSSRSQMYANSVKDKCGLSVMNCIGFIDGTKQYISRPSPRENAPTNENLQRAAYNGHPRRHCLNWQGITAPDGIGVGMYGPVEELMKSYKTIVFTVIRLMDVNSAYRVHSEMPGSPEAAFNAVMSSVRESVEWSFHIIKSLWGYVSVDKKMKVRNSPVGMFWLVAALLTNCNSCLKPQGNQISMYFGLRPPTLEEYLTKSE